jgi:hypothetical protein
MHSGHCGRRNRATTPRTGNPREQFRLGDNIPQNQQKPSRFEQLRAKEVV